MKLKCLLLLAAVAASVIASAQVDVRSGSVFNLGFGSRHVQHQGLLSFVPKDVSQNDWATSPQRTMPVFHCKGLGSEISATDFAEQGWANYDVSGLVYLLSMFPYTIPEHQGKWNGLIGLKTTELTNGNYPYLDYYQQRLWSWKLIDVTAIFGKHDVGFGFDLSLRELRYSPFTFYSSANDQTIVWQRSWQSGKLMIGPAIGYRKTVGSLSFAVLAGVNTSPNLGEGMRVTYAPFYKPTIYFGKKLGAFVSLYYESMHSKGGMHNNYNYDSFKYREFKLCVGLYLNRNND